MRRDTRYGCDHRIFSIPNRQSGLTLPEALTVLAVIGILGTFGVSMAGVIRENRLTAGINDLHAALSLARTNAISRQTDIVVCPSRDQRRCDGPDNR